MFSFLLCSNLYLVSVTDWYNATHTSLPVHGPGPRSRSEGRYHERTEHVPTPASTGHGPSVAAPQANSLQSEKARVFISPTKLDGG